MRVIGIDPAIKSLAISILDFNDNWKNDLNDIVIKYNKDIEDPIENLNNLYMKCKALLNLLNKLVKLHYVAVFDLLPGENVNKTSIEKRIRRLKGCINHVKLVNENIIPKKNIDKVLIEKQMSKKIEDIFAGLAYDFSLEDSNFKCISNIEINQNKSIISHKIIEMVGPALKSKIYFGDDSNKIQNFRKRYINNYTANKSHAKKNFLIWLEKNDCLEYVKNIPKKNIDDVADSFLMAYGWCFKNFIR